MIRALDFVNEARALVGVPWLHQGRTRLGVDCIGLVVLAAKNAGLDLFKEAGCTPVRKYGRQASPELYDLVAKHCVQSIAPAPGCVCLFKFNGDKHARHFGILTDAGTMIHAEARTRKCVIEHGYRMRWASEWTDSVWRLPGVIYE